MMSKCDCNRCRTTDSTAPSFDVTFGQTVFGCALCDVDPESSKEVRAVVAWLAKVARLQLDKNRKYGGSVSSPVRIFSKSDEVEGIKVRIDDKLSRVAAGAHDEDEDVLLDLVGYLAWLATQKK